MKNLLTFAGGVFMATVMFGLASAQVTVTAVGATTSSVTPIFQSAPTVLSGSVSGCPNLLNSFQKFGNQGQEVVKLQMFLNRVNGAKLNGLGYFGPVTQAEVKNFQYTYGIKPTGYQHVLTTQMINDINCGKVNIKPRRVYVAKQSLSSYVSNSTTTYVAPKVSNFNNEKIIKEYTAPKNIKLTGSTTKAVATSSKLSFWENLQNDWDKIKDNYKAYLLVFVLVLALFWFLRKAATE